MGDAPLVGLAVASYNSSKVDRGAFAHFELCREVAPPEAGFVGWPVSGTLPLTVTFANTTTGQVSGCLWSYGDGVTGTTSLITHTHVYTQAGVYTVSLAATGPGGTDALTRTGYITVTGHALSTTVISYTYDPLNRLTRAEYDAVGNRKAMTTTRGAIRRQAGAVDGALARADEPAQRRLSDLLPGHRSGQRERVG